MIPQNGQLSGAERREQVERVLRSGILQNAPMLQKLLEFLAARIEAGSSNEATEYAVAAEVFGRTADFDPTGDTTVRTAVYRLRLKIRDYYKSDGRNDEVIISIPKGRYELQFERREPARTTPLASDDSFEVVPKRQPVQIGVLAMASVAALAIGVLAGWQLASRRPALADRVSMSGQLGELWSSFAGPEKLVLVTFANVEMLHTETGDLLKFQGGAIDDRGAKVARSVAEASVTSPDLVGKHTFFYEDGYSGEGEVEAVYHLTHLLSRSGIGMQIKRSRLVTSDDLKNHNVLLLGAGRENIPVDNLRLKQGYVFDTPGRLMWSNTIRDLKDVPGRHPSFAVERDPANGALKTDYALLSVVPGMDPNRKIMMLAGLTTSGTLGAVEFATSEAQIETLLSQIEKSSGRRVTALPRYFESILEVRVVKGLDPIAVRCVAARTIE